MRTKPYVIYELDFNMVLPVHFTATVGNSRSTSLSRFLIHPSVSCSSLLYTTNHTYNGLQTALVDTDEHQVYKVQRLARIVIVFKLSVDRSASQVPLHENVGRIFVQLCPESTGQ